MNAWVDVDWAIPFLKETNSKRLNEGMQSGKNSE
jgi:hypothetical protein